MVVMASMMGSNTFPLLNVYRNGIIVLVPY